MLARTFLRKTVTRQFSANPRVTIAQNYMVLEQLQGATDDASLNAALQSGANFDAANIPAGLASMEDLLKE